MTRLLSEIETAHALGYSTTAEWRRARRANQVPESTVTRGKRAYWSSEVIARFLDSLQNPGKKATTQEDVRKRIAETTL